MLYNNVHKIGKLNRHYHKIVLLSPTQDENKFYDQD